MLLSLGKLDQMKKLLSILNLLSIVAIIYWNYLVATGFINNRDMAELSNNINSLFTPANYAFSIWSIIYLMLTINAVWIVVKAFKGNRNKDLISATIYLPLAHLASGLWLYFWQTEQYAVSVFCMLAIFLFLMVLIVKLNMQKWDAPASTIGLLWWPISLYSGWITAATVTNIAAYLKVNDFQWLFSEATWTIIILVITTLVYLYMISSRYMRMYGAVGIWALIAIAIRHIDTLPNIAYTAIACAVVIALISAVQGFKYRKQNPFFQKLFG